MTTKKSLQKFTESEKRIQAVLDQDEIKPGDRKHLSEAESKEVAKRINDALASSNDTERVTMMNKASYYLDEDIKNRLWEYNHNQITSAIATLMQDCGRMPDKNQLAEKTGLSRQTIHKHLKGYAVHPMYLGQIEQFSFMAEKVLAKVFHFAVNGDMKAAKLYFEIISNSTANKQGNIFIKNQSNYIQINGLTVNQEQIKNLSSDQLNQIENIIKLPLTLVETTNK